MASRKGDWTQAYSAEWEKVCVESSRQWKSIAKQSPGNSRGILLGQNLAAPSKLYIDPQEGLGTHMHILGATKTGKSYFLENVLKNLIVQGHGICLITPHPDIYHRMLHFCAAAHLKNPNLKLAKRVVMFDPSDKKRIIGFNPVARNARVMTYQVVALMEAIRKCWGQANFQETPRLARWLFNTSYGVVQARLTLLQATRLVDSKPSPLRDAIVRRIENPEIRAEWEWIRKRNVSMQEEKLESTYLRFVQFSTHEILRCILGQHTATLDIPSVLGKGKILLVNLSRENTIHEDHQHLLGTLLVNEILTAAFARPEGKRRPFYLAIDEFQHFVTKDMCEILDGGRKFGLHLLLAHQFLRQLKKTDEEVYYSALTNARTKVVFGGLSEEDLDVIGPEMYARELDPYQVKDEIWRIAYDPVETTRLLVSTNESEGESEAEGKVTHISLEANGLVIDQSEPIHESTSQQSSRTQQRSRAESLVPWYEYHSRQELSSRTFLSLEEQLFLKKAQLKLQPTQHAAILIPGEHVAMVKTPTIRDYFVSDRQLGEFKEECFEGAGCYKTMPEAEREIAAMENRLLAPEPIIINVTPVKDGDDTSATPSSATVAPAVADDDDFD